LERVVQKLVLLFQELQSTIEDIYVASIETDRGTREKVRFYDTAGLDSGKEQNQLARQYLGLTDGYVLIYDPDRPESLDALVMVKKDIDRNRDKKEVLEYNHILMNGYNTRLLFCWM
jgi:NF-kappa-B inhibitor-interacting Ras-like protein